MSKSVISHQRYKLFNTNDPSGKDARFQNLDFGLSRAVRAGNLVFLQGQTGRAFDGNFVGKGDPAAQADNAMRCVKKLPEEAGASMQNICKITTYVKRHSDRSLVYPFLAEHLKGINPVSTGLIVTGFGNKNVDFEIDVFAVIPEEISSPSAD